jgi:hypothetical protein
VLGDKNKTIYGADTINHYIGKGYKAVEAQPVDMFPRTDCSKDIRSVLSCHVESIILMTNSGLKGK